MRYREIIERKDSNKSKLSRVNQRGIYPEPIDGDELEKLDPVEIEKREKLKRYQEMTDDERRLARIPEIENKGGYFKEPDV